MTRYLFHFVNLKVLSSVQKVALTTIDTNLSFNHEIKENRSFKYDGDRERKHPGYQKDCTVLKLYLSIDSIHSAHKKHSHLTQRRQGNKTGDYHSGIDGDGDVSVG